MRIFPFTKKKHYFNDVDQAGIVAAIQSSEKRTSGEIRVYVESKNPFMDPIDRASEVFFNLKMEETQHRNAVLLYIAMKDKELALFADEGIYQAGGAEFWNAAVKKMLSQFTKENISKGIEQCIRQVGDVLTEKFPYQPNEDKNELPDEIVFGD